MKISKKNILTTGLAVTLAATITIGGTFAYLQSQTEDVVNNFQANKVLVSLVETKEGYNIIPGTEQDKDPTVTVDNTVDAYVFVEVNDQTRDMVGYEIADGWTELPEFATTTVKVYYRTVAKDADTKVFSVLKGDKVSYSAALENKDMLIGDKLRTTLNLSFKAYAIQQQPFADAAEAYVAQPKTVSTATELKRALSVGSPVVLSGDLTTTGSNLAGGLKQNAENQIDLNGHKLTLNTNIAEVKENCNLTIKNGTVEAKAKNYAFDLNSNSSVTLDNVEWTASSANYGLGGPKDYAQHTTFNVIDSTVTVKEGYMIISTNASVKDGIFASDVTINIKNSTLSITQPKGDCVGILLNVPGRLNIENSTITADRQAVIVRGGEAVIKDSVLNCTASYSNLAEYDEKDWGDGNNLPSAVLVVGDRNNSYNYDATCTLDNSTLNYTKDCDRRVIYAAAYGGHNTYIYGGDKAGDLHSTVTGSSDDDSQVVLEAYPSGK